MKKNVVIARTDDGLNYDWLEVGGGWGNGEPELFTLQDANLKLASALFTAPMGSSYETKFVWDIKR